MGLEPINYWLPAEPAAHRSYATEKEMRRRSLFIHQVLVSDAALDPRCGSAVPPASPSSCPSMSRQTFKQECAAGPSRGQCFNLFSVLYPL
ncbi:hypothetical protein EYF80_061244 [Liparis tanakae]|uniref:Uncharacterized protein n=1 Tax=Liparis tanakae TaxID=230148 RepID=A0A4Z2EIM8_9TELE|nr:hypothetical protein EYF80_061244 [Liparis tanakae]